MGQEMARSDVASAAGDWLLRNALPLWAEHGVDWKQGGFHDALDLNGLHNTADFKRLRVTARQIYVFSVAESKGFSGAADIVRHGLDFMMGPLRCSTGGFYSRCNLNGVVTDREQDLYDLAFALFALASAYRIVKNEALRIEANSLVNYLAENLRHPLGGYHESTRGGFPRRQNPHMHLFEASLTALESFGDIVFARLALDLYELYKTRFLSEDLSCINEYFNDDWSLDTTSAKGIVEPGHHMEWFWLISRFRRLFPMIPASADVAAKFALNFGYDKHMGFMRAELYDDGSVKEASVRLWPHCEWVRAAAVVEEGSDLDLQLVHAWTSLSKFLDVPVKGLWHERWSASGLNFESGSVPASSLYHLVGAVKAVLTEGGDGG